MYCKTNDHNWKLIEWLEVPSFLRKGKAQSKRICHRCWRIEYLTRSGEVVSVVEPIQ